MSAPTRARNYFVRSIAPVGPTVARTEWFAGASINGRHAITYWRRGANGKIPALCGMTDVLWSTSGDGKVCPVCAHRVGDVTA